MIVIKFKALFSNVFRLDCDTDTVAAIGGSVAEEFYKGTGFDNEKILNAYLDENLLGILRA